MQINFKIDETYLITHILAMCEPNRYSSDEHRRDIVDLQNVAWDASKDLFNMIVGRPYPFIYSNKEELTNLGPRLVKYFETIRNHDVFRKVLGQTQDYAKHCQEQWKSTQDQAEKFIKEVTGFPLDHSFNIYLTHRSGRNGQYIGDNNILWGHHEDWPFYDTVYIWHEILHAYFSHSDEDHIIIQFIADCELRKKLSGLDYPPFIGHKELIPLMEKTYGLWQDYLKSKEKSLNHLQALINKALQK